MAQLSRALGIDPADDLAVIHKEIVDGPHLPSSEWAAAAAAFAEGSTNDQEQAARLTEALAASDAARPDAYLGVFFTDKGEPRASVITGSLARKYPVSRRRGSPPRRPVSKRWSRGAAPSSAATAPRRWSRSRAR